MRRQPDDLEISILALFERKPLNRHGAHRIDDILKQMPANSISYDDLATMLSDMIHAGWLVGRVLPGPGGVAADIVDMDITPQGMELVGENNAGDVSSEVVLPETSSQSSSAAQPQPPKCFISYSWDSDDHKSWVRRLAEGLRAYHVDAVLDRWSAQPGTDLAHFMEQAGETDFVVVVCTPEYAQKADAGAAGVGYEKRIITAKLRSLHPDDGRIIPVLRGVGARAIPTFLTDLTYIDFTSDDEFNERLQELARAIFGKPECVPPPLGPMPEFRPAVPLYVPPPHKEDLSNPVDADSGIQRERMKRYPDVFPRIAGLFLEPDIQSLPPAVSELKIREIIARTVLLSGPLLEQLLLQYCDEVVRFQTALRKPEDEEAKRLHAELVKLVGRIGEEVRNEIGMNRNSKTLGQQPSLV
jgi:hypothetical protein